MIPSHQQAKDSQDEARRQQQADEKIRELEEEAEALREQLKKREAEIDRLQYALQKIKKLPAIDEIYNIAADALDGRGDQDD